MSGKIAIGCDEAAFQFKEHIKKALIDFGWEPEDYGVYNEDPVLYPDIAHKVALDVSLVKCGRGILICGTGIGMCITANKVPGIRAAVCHDVYSAERSRKSNNAQIMCMGSRVIAPQLGVLLVKTWLESEFDGGGSAQKVDRIMKYEQDYLKQGEVKPCSE